MSFSRLSHAFRWASLPVQAVCILGGLCAPVYAQQTLNAVGDTWIREINPETIFEDDLISVWSSFNTSPGEPGNRRYGLIEFDVSSLAGQVLTNASLSLWVDDTFSGTLHPVRQKAYVIDSGGTPLTSLTWNTYFAEKDATRQVLESLGSFDEGIPNNNGTAGTYVSDGGASAADLALVEAAANSASGLLSLVLIANEDGTEYRGDWGDLGFAGQPGKLTVTTAAPPGCEVLTQLPDATRGQAYSQSVVDTGGCTGPTEVMLVGCALPPGLTLDALTGQISGTPIMNGAYPFTVQLLDDQMTVLDEQDVELHVTGTFNTGADVDYDGDVDLIDFHTFALTHVGAMSVVPCDPGPPPPGLVELTAIGDVWIRESDSTTTYESDWVSVWSAPSGDRRYGLIEFDVSSLAGESIGAANLSLWVADSFSGTQFPVKQEAYMIDSGGTPLTSLDWDTYFAEKDAGKQMFEALGAYDEGAPNTSGTLGTYLDDGGASAADLALISAEAGSDGILSIVLIADEDGTEYRGDWGDGTNAGGPGFTETPAKLRILLGSPCTIATTSLPSGEAGVPYAAEIETSAACSGSLSWEVIACDLPEGLSLNPATGVISGVPVFGGTFDFRIRLTDQGLGGVIREQDLSITLGQPSTDFDEDGDVDDVDFQVLADSFTGPLDPDLHLCWRDYVQTCLDTLIARGTDRYGSVQSAMLMSIIDVNTLDSPENPPLEDDNIRTEGRPSHGRRSPGGCNLWHDMATLRVMYRMSDLTGDPTYAQGADDYIMAYFQQAVKPNGLLYWGSHSYYHAFNETFGGDGIHEILVHHPQWDRMYAIDPSATLTEVDGIWTWHVWDKVNGEHNRHDDGNPGADFAFSGGSFAIAFAAAYVQTGDPTWLDRAKLVGGWHWQQRDPVTNLVPDVQGGAYAFTSVVGPHATQLLRCYELTGDVYFLNIATDVIKAYDQYGWDAAAGSYYATIQLDGTPVPQQTPVCGKNPEFGWLPTGHVDVWRTIMFTWEFPLIAAQAALYAYEMSVQAGSPDAQLLAIAERWAEAIRNGLPPQLGRRWECEVISAMPNVLNTGGTYAENYGRATSFFVNLYHATGDIEHLRLAKVIAREAIAKLYVNGIFRGHPAKDFYAANDFVGILLHALMQLDALPGQWRLAF